MKKDQVAMSAGKRETSIPNNVHKIRNDSLIVKQKNRNNTMSPAVGKEISKALIFSQA